MNLINSYYIVHQPVSTYNKYGTNIQHVQCSHEAMTYCHVENKDQ